MRLKSVLLGAIGLVALGGAGLYAAKIYVDADHTGVALLPPDGPPVVQSAPADWAATRSARNDAKSAYLTEKQIAFDWFANFPFSQTDGTSLILLRLLPLIDPDRWQGGDKLLSEVGLFMDPRSDIGFLPRGIGFSGLDPAASEGALDMTSFTCGACHIGRVTGADGETVYIDGAVNTTFDINKYYVQTYAMLQEIYGAETEREAQIDKLTAVVLAALDEAVALSPTYFYEDFRRSYRAYDATYEAQQVALFRAEARREVTRFADYTEGFVDAFTALLDKSYGDYKAAMLAGLPGMADATGVSASHGYKGLKAKIGATLAGILLPSNPGITDYMPVWEQDLRASKFDPTGKKLIDGGGQYNGNIPIPVFRNLAAATTMGLENPDIRVPAFAEALLGGLPATPYPFAVDTEKAKIGEALFTAHCADCHQPHNGAVYDTLGTSPARANVINTALMLSGRRLYQGYCSPDLELDLAGTKTKPCAAYDGVSLKGFGTAIMRPLADQKGYNATPLRGIWASAPYLHNGSVPTMRHLLMPGTRPDTFTRGLLGYDEADMGFVWSDDGSGTGMVFDTSKFHAVRNTGHDVDVTAGRKTYKLDWTDDPSGADALIEYLKTL